MSPQEEALEAAKLAKAVSSQLGLIDKLSTERPERPANQININSFISKVVDPSRKNAASSSGYVPEELVQSLVPEPTYAFPQTPVIENAVKEPVIHQLPQIGKRETKNQKSEPVILTSEDKNIKKIANSLERIAKSYEKYVECFINCNTINKQTNILNE